MKIENPSVLWIVTTQWRAQAFGYAGDPNARTPSIDALAGRGISFRQAVTPHPFGPFARAALLTGIRSPENGVRDYHDPLPADARTIAHGMEDRGYSTAFFGNWQLGNRDPRTPPVGEANARLVVPAAARGGFAFWEGFESGFQLNDPWLHGTRLPIPTRFPGYQSDVVCRRATDWISQATGRWFAMVSLEPPHPPYDAPAAGIERIPADRIALAPNVPTGGAAEDRARRELAGYYAHIEATDRAIGTLLKGAARAGPIIVVFTSVHGDMHGSHGLFRKGWPYEESVRVPLLVQVPGGRAATSDEAISLVELPRLTLAMIDAPDPGAAIVASRVPGAASEISMPSVVARAHQCDRVWHGTRSRDRKRIFNADGTPWLEFDLRQDPLELRDLGRAQVS